MIFAEACTELAQFASSRARSACRCWPTSPNLENATLHLDELRGAGVAMVLYPLSAFRAMNAAAVATYRAIRADGTQRAVVDRMQTREQLYEVLNYHADERKLDARAANR